MLKEKQLDPSVHSFCQCIGAGCILPVRPSGARSRICLRRPPPTAPAAPAPAAPASQANSMPKPNRPTLPRPLPTKEAVNAFLKPIWEMTQNRIWEVWAIEKTPVEGVSKVTVLINDKSETQKPVGVQFYGMPDGKHFIIRGEKGLMLLPADAETGAARRFRPSRGNCNASDPLRRHREPKLSHAQAIILPTSALLCPPKRPSRIF